MLTSNQLSTLKQIVVKELHQLKRTDGELKADSTSELSTYDNHPADLGTELTDKQTQLTMNEHRQAEVKKHEEALQAMKEGTYGICKACGEPISYERLEAIPTTLYCQHHAMNDSKSSGRPVEEDVLSQSMENGEQRNDRLDSFEEVAAYGTSETPSDFLSDEVEYEKKRDTEGYTEEYEQYGVTDLEGNKKG
ncbi:TraR/DksA C4-type zinc finger protein [Metabacillus sp. HB246100]|uniref:TraR/DksA C4-type zinc finger protein n=1 Tax=Bacillus weihaiensis TaxID=1547283 RepID=UPI002353114B|nr:TraR/DksA C4-type zinc finger protein [Bacillus weihaiensis]